MKPSAIAALALLFGALLGAPAWAHGGEDHGDEAHETALPARPEVTAVTAVSAGRQGEAASEVYELVLRAARLEAGSPQEITILLADFETNRPVQGAVVEIEVSGPATASVQAAAAKDPGIYVARLRLAEPGAYQLIASITDGENADLLTVDGLVVEKAQAGSGLPRWPQAGLFLGAAAAVLALLAGIYHVARRRLRPATLLLALIVPLAGPPAWAHEGHDHGDEPAGAAPAPPGTSIRIPKESQFLLGIRTVPAKEREVRQTVLLLGRLEAPPHQVAQLHAPVPGRLSSLKMAQLGDRVRKGQVLAVVEQVLSASEQIQLASDKLRLDTERARLEADIAQAEQDTARAQADLGRAQRLRDIVPRKALLEAEIGLRKAQEGLRGLKTQHSLFQKMKPPEIGQARRFSVNAPFDGVITESHATFGEQVEPSKLLFRVVNTRTLWAVADVFERDLTRVAEARGAKVRLDAMSGKAYPARLVSFGTVVDARTRSLPVRFELPNYLGRLKPGMFAKVEVDLGGSRQALSIPREAVSKLGDDPVVFVHTTAEQFAIRPVTLGPEDGSWVVVAAGLAPGDRVVTEGVFQLKATAEKGAARK